MDKRTSQPQHRRRSNCAACHLRGAMLCSDIGVKSLADSRVYIDDLTIGPRDTLFQADAPASGVFFIRSGFVKLVEYSRTGTQRIVRIVKPGGVAGMEAMFSSSFEHSAVAMGNVAACRIPAGDFRHMMNTNPALQRRLLEYSHQALREAEAWLSELAGGNAQTRERMALLLLRLRDGETTRIPRFTVEDVGAILGISMETASRVLSEFARANLLTKGHATAGIRCYRADIAGLERIAMGRDTARATIVHLAHYKGWPDSLPLSSNVGPFAAVDLPERTLSAKPASHLHLIPRRTRLEKAHNFG